MTKVLNAQGIVPDFYSFRFRLDAEAIEKHYGEKIEINLRTIPQPTLPFEWNITSFNFLVNKRVKDYDLVINHNNTSLGLDAQLNLLNYIHYARKSRLYSAPLFAGLLNYKRDPLLLNKWLYLFDRKRKPNEMLVANSKFTAARFEKYYDANVDHVLYPPVDIHFQKGIKNPKRIVSLGRFAPHKRQLEQIQVFHELTDFEFYLIGFKNNEAYFNSLAAYIAEHKMTNVHLVADASEQERNDLLTSATYFIHALREEPFGITTVQGIAAGCLPLVHNSGGQREVVPFEELRYQHERDISERVRYIESKGTAEDLQAKLTAHIQAYESTTFRAEFKKLLDQKLPAK